MQFINYFIVCQRMDHSDAPDVKTGLALYQMWDCMCDISLNTAIETGKMPSFPVGWCYVNVQTRLFVEPQTIET